MQRKDDWMNIVFLVEDYYPNYSAVGRCVGNIAEELAKVNKVFIICLKDSANEKNREEYLNQSIIRINTNDNKIRNKLEKHLRIQKGFKKIIASITLKVYKLIQMIISLFSYVTLRKGLVKGYLKALESINEPIDLIIPTSMPFESVVAATKYIEKSRNTQMIPYLFDQYVESATLHRFNFNRIIKRSRHLKFEEMILSKSSNVLAMHSFKEYYSEVMPDFKKITYVEHPLIIDPKDMIENEINYQEKMKISYIGGLYRNYVEPDYLLKLYGKSSLENSTLNFYIVGNCDNRVNKYAKLFPEKVYNHGSVSKETANKKMLESDILISIAEENGIQMSSKIFEYMSMGKPIVHFYTVSDDVNLKILKKYPLALLLKQDYKYLDKNIKLFNDYCRKNYNSAIPFDMVKQIFREATPEYTVNLILEILE